MPLPNRYKEIGITAEVNFKTIRPVHATAHSRIDQVVLDTATWEASVGFGLEQCVEHGTVCCYARNHGLGLVIP